MKGFKYFIDNWFPVWNYIMPVISFPSHCSIPHSCAFWCPFVIPRISLVILFLFGCGRSVKSTFEVSHIEHIVIFHIDVVLHQVRVKIQKSKSFSIIVQFRIYLQFSSIRKRVSIRFVFLFLQILFDIIQILVSRSKVYLIPKAESIQQIMINQMSTYFELAAWWIGSIAILNRRNLGHISSKVHY